MRCPVSREARISFRHFVWNLRTCSEMLKEKCTSGKNCEAEIPMFRSGRGRLLVVALKRLYKIAEAKGAGDRRLVRVNWRQEEPSC